MTDQSKTINSRRFGMGRLVDVATACREIQTGKYFTVAADAKILEELPAGNWIGGSICYFLDAVQGGVKSKDRVFLTEVAGADDDPIIQTYSEDTIAQICSHTPDNGFSLVIIPGFSRVHELFASEAPNFDEMFVRPLTGWISGVDLEDELVVKPRVVNGLTRDVLENQAVALHVSLPQEQRARLEIIHPFTAAGNDSITFPTTGFEADLCEINGTNVLLSNYIRETGIDTRLPLIADYCGADINVSIKRVDDECSKVAFYAPIFKGVAYKFAKPVEDYLTAFSSAIHLPDGEVVFSCNCILNYLYMGLEGKKLPFFSGPVTFGEIAYQLVNQTLVHLCVETDTVEVA